MNESEASSRYWCHICYEMVNPIPNTESVKCPICEGEFLEEMATASNLRSVSLLLKGSYLSTPRTEKVSEDGENGRLKYGVSSMQGWRLTMEDAHAAYSNLDGSTSFFGVYDGHGGKEVAQFCAKFLHGQVLEHEAYKAGDLRTSIQRAFLRMDEMMCGETGQKELALLRGKVDQSGGDVEDIFDSEQDNDALSEGHSDYEGPSSGSTACVAIVQNNTLLVANAGDSRCIISRKGQAQDLSKDHKPNLDVENNRITEAGGYVENGRVNGRLNLTRAIGDMQLKQNKSLPAEKQIVTANPDIISVKLSDADDFLVIASDGIWNCMSSQEVVDFIQEHMKTERKLSVICERVIDRCLSPTSEGEGSDNMTIVLVQFKGPSETTLSLEQQPVPSVQ